MLAPRPRETAYSPRQDWRQGAGRWFLATCFLTLLWCLLVPQIASANSAIRPIDLPRGDGPISVAPFAQVLEDPSRKLTLSEVRAPDLASSFKPSGDSLEFGFSSSAFWIRFQVVNRSVSTKEYVLDTSYPMIDSIRIHAFREQHHEEWTLGDTQPFSARSVDALSFAQNFQVEPGELVDFYIRVETTSSASVPFKLYHAKQYAEHLHDHLLLLGLFYGVAIGLIAYNFSLYLGTRERTYLYYVAFCFSNACFSSCLDGLNYLVLPDFVYFQRFATYEFISLSAMFALGFTRSYLNTQDHLPRLNKIIRNSERAFLSAAVCLWFYHPYWFTTSVLCSLIVAVTLVATSAFLRIRQGYGPAKLFLTSWVVLLTTIAFGVSAAILFVELYALLPYLYKFGASCEMILLSIALANRINNLKAAEKEALQAAELAKSSAKAKSEFLATMSHEIRTPINGVLGMAELLRETPLNPSQSNYIRTIEVSGRALIGVINDILDFSKLDSGKMQLEDTVFDLEEMLDDVGRLFSLRSSENRVALINDYDTRLPKTLRGDPTRIRQILINLISNAFKFTEAGTIQLKTLVLDSSDDRCKVRFEVTDTGIGIPPESLERIFASFSQADSSITRKYGGTGLGLSISSKLVAAMGGEIGVKSVVDRGSTFWFDLTFTLESSSTTTLAHIQEEFETLRSKRVLLLGAKTASRESLARTLSDCFDQVEVVEPPDLDSTSLHPELAIVVVEEDLDTTNQTLQSLTESGCKCLVVLDPQASSLREKLESSARIRCLSAPPGRVELRTKIRELFDDADSCVVSVPVEKPAPVPRSTLRVLVAEDNKINQAVLKGMLKKLGILPTLVNNGAEAVEAVKKAECPFDLIFMDCEMPVLDGYSAARAIRALPSQAKYRTVVFALTAHAMDSHRQDALAAGMDDHFTKPISLETIRGALRRWEELQQAA